MPINKESPIRKRIMDIKYRRILWLTKRIKELKEKIKLYKLVHLILIFLLVGCANPLQVTIKKDLETQKNKRLETKERESILQSFNNSGIILKSFEQLDCSIFDIASFLNEYGKSDIDGFCDYLAEKYPFNTWHRWALDKEIFDIVKRNYELLKRLERRMK